MHRQPNRDQNHRSHVSTTRHSASRSHNPTVLYEVEGEIRWLDRELQRVVVHVAEANGHAGRLRGENVTFGLERARILVDDLNADGSRDAADLLPGVRVRVRARLPRSLDDGVPELISATSIGMLPLPAD